MSCRSLGLRRFGSRPRAGFTLVELLVVISIIGMLMALLLPAVQQAREAGRRNTCNNNLHNASLAVMNFATAKNQYPGYVQALPLSGGAAGGASASGTSSYVYPVSWVVPILPYMERTDVYNIWRSYANWTVAGGSANVPPAIYIEALNCPSTPPTSKKGNTPCVYVANSGMLDQLSTTSYPADWQANGVFFNQLNLGATSDSGAAIVSQDNKTTIASQVANIGPQVTMSQDYITVHDGSSLTLMLSENNNAPLASLASGAVTATAPQSPGSGFWGPGGGAPMAGSFYGAGTEPQNCFVWWPDQSPQAAMKINAPVAITSTGTVTETNPAYYMHPASNHPTGAMVAFCDAHTRFISQDIDYSVFCLLMTPYGQYCNTPAYVPASGGTPLDTGASALGTTYYPSGTSNYTLLRTKPIDESEIN